MPKVLSIREETPEEAALRKWWAAQALDSPKNLEEAARLLVGLVTGLLGALFTVLTVSAETLPAYMSLPLVKASGVAAVVLWLASLLAGLVVVLPRRWSAAPGKPDTQSQMFKKILGYKSAWLTACVIAFGLAVVALGIALVTALLVA